MKIRENFGASNFTFQSKEEEGSGKQEAADHGVSLPTTAWSSSLTCHLLPLLLASGGQHQARKEQVPVGDPGARQVA